MIVYRNRSRSFKKILGVSCVILSSYINLSIAATVNPIDTTVRYLDPGVWHKTVDQNHCFNAAPNSLLVVEPVNANGQRSYNVTQYFDQNVERTLYAKSLEQQIKEKKIVGTHFCQGIVSISDMKLPITKNNSIVDVNDGILLTEAARRSAANVMFELNNMAVIASQAANGVNNQWQFKILDYAFQAHKKLLESVVNNARFASIGLFDGSNEKIDILVGNTGSSVSIPLTNFNADSTGLNIENLEVADSSGASMALSRMDNLSSPYIEFNALKIAAEQLKTYADQIGTTTFVDVTTDEFIVQRKNFLAKSIV